MTPSLISEFVQAPLSWLATPLTEGALQGARCKTVCAKVTCRSVNRLLKLLVDSSVKYNPSWAHSAHPVCVPDGHAELALTMGIREAVCCHRLWPSSALSDTFLKSIHTRTP